MKYTYIGINILLFLFLCNLLFGVWQSWPSRHIITAINNYQVANNKLQKENANLMQQIHQASNRGPILQHNIRYYYGFVADKERFYKVKNWF